MVPSNQIFNHYGYLDFECLEHGTCKRARRNRGTEDEERCNWESFEF